MAHLRLVVDVGALRIRLLDDRHLAPADEDHLGAVDHVVVRLRQTQRAAVDGARLEQKGAQHGDHPLEQVFAAAARVGEGGEEVDEELLLEAQHLPYWEGGRRD
eukprot:4443423-Prymnesium_polylepis.1